YLKQGSEGGSVAATNCRIYGPWRSTEGWAFRSAVKGVTSGGTHPGFAVIDCPPVVVDYMPTVKAMLARAVQPRDGRTRLNAMIRSAAEAAAVAVRR
ncbi:MAG: hypothetical protein JWO31_3275, partial [Phycisphaerales bacterium]|nr:hypothetical protein [Phycisphaerales bacterium]